MPSQPKRPSGGYGPDLLNLVLLWILIFTIAASVIIVLASLVSAPSSERELQEPAPCIKTGGGI